MTLASFNDPKHADALAQLLRNGGFAVEVQDERNLQKAWFRSRRYAGLHVCVSETVYPEAQEYLASHSTADDLLRHAVRCPSCGASRIQYPAMTRKNILPTLVAQMLVLVGFSKRECYCEACHYTWRPVPKSGRSDE